MTTLNAASAQWANRPDDQRFLTIDDLQAAVDARRQISASKVLQLRQLESDHDGERLVINGPGLEGAEMTNWSFGQLCSQVGAPAQYLRKLPAAVADVNLGYGLRFSEASKDDVRVLYTRNGKTEVRAATGPKYGRIWDSQIVQAVRRMNSDGRWTVPTPFRKVEDASNSSNFAVDKKSTTLYASDRDIFLFLVDERNPIEVDGQAYFRGFYTWNSEVGKATFGLATFLYSYVCANRIIWGANQIEELRIRHTSLAPDRFIQEATPALAAIADSSPQPIIRAIQAAKETYVGKTVGDVEEFLAKKGFGKLESKVAIQLAAQNGDTGSKGDPTNLWDLIAGGTAAAREIGQQDDRVDAERKWSNLLREVSAN